MKFSEQISLDGWMDWLKMVFGTSPEYPAASSSHTVPVVCDLMACSEGKLKIQNGEG